MDKEIKIRTDLNQRQVQEHLAPLKEDLDNENVFLSIESSEYHGMISELTVLIAGGVSVYLITKLIDIVINRIVSGNKANVKIVHIENNVTFILPDQSEDAKEYFKSQKFMIYDKIKSEVSAGTIIPQPISDGYQVKGYGKSRGQEALVYLIPNHNNPNSPNTKRVPKSDWEEAYEYLKEHNKLTREWFEKNTICAKDGGCNFTVIGGVFSFLGIAEYDEDGYYVKVKEL